jgi:aminocarboxymuconate-semialdehyde decarboxylase
VNPRNYLGRFWIDALVHDPVALSYITDVMGAEKVCMGSDYPFPLGEHVPGNLIRQCFATNPDAQARLLRSNALAWLGLPDTAFGS